MIAAVLAILPALAQAPDMTLARERSIGDVLVGEFRKKWPPLDAPDVQRYANTLGQRVVAALLAPTRIPYMFEVIDTPLMDPIPLPGGYILIPASLFLTVQNESQLAERLAHAIAHIELRHFENGASGQIPIIIPVHADPSDSRVVPHGVRDRLLKLEAAADAFALPIATREEFASSPELPRIRALVIEAQPKRRPAPTLHKQ